MKNNFVTTSLTKKDGKCQTPVEKTPQSLVCPMSVSTTYENVPSYIRRNPVEPKLLIV